MEETKKCPMCAEVIMAAAVKCKHCGETLTTPAPSTATPPVAKKPGSGFLRSTVSWMGKHRLVPACIAISVVIGGLCLVLRDSDLLVALHSDVQWHRQWQDQHTDKERARVSDLYAGLYKKHAEDPAYAYLAARALPSGKEQTDAFGKAAEKFPDSPWIAWGQASVEEDDDSANELRLKALSMFKDEPPAQIVGSTVWFLARASEWEKLGDTHKKYSRLINSDGAAACEMTTAEFRRGNHAGALAWASKAQSLGCDDHKDLRGTIDGMKAIGMAPDVFSNPSTNEGGSFQLGKVEVSEASGGSSLRLDLKYWHGRPESTIFPDKCFVKTKRGTKIFSTTSGYVDVRANEKKDLRLDFKIPSGETVDNLTVNTGLVYGSAARLIKKEPGAPMNPSMTLGSIGDEAIVGISPE